MKNLCCAGLLLASVLLTACSPADRSAPHRSPAQAPLRDELLMLAGPKARACGLVALGQDPTAAWACAQAADSQGTAYWFAVQHRGIDSQAWSAALLTPDGKRYLLTYDSNYRGGPGLLPRFIRDTCDGRFVLIAQSQRELHCSRK